MLYMRYLDFMVNKGTRTRTVLRCRKYTNWTLDWMRPHGAVVACYERK